jgi:hypothetical protein
MFGEILVLARPDQSLWAEAVDFTIGLSMALLAFLDRMIERT